MSPNTDPTDDSPDAAVTAAPRESEASPSVRNGHESGLPRSASMFSTKRLTPKKTTASTAIKPTKATIPPMMAALAHPLIPDRGGWGGTVAGGGGGWGGGTAVAGVS